MKTILGGRGLRADQYPRLHKLGQYGILSMSVRISDIRFWPKIIPILVLNLGYST